MGVVTKVDETIVPDTSDWRRLVENQPTVLDDVAHLLIADSMFSGCSCDVDDVPAPNCMAV
jgi:hypothetical protein